MHKISELIVDMLEPCPVCKAPGAVYKDGVLCKCFACALDAIKTKQKGGAAHLPPFWIADPEIKAMAAKLINEHHPEAANAKVCYLMRKKHTVSNGAVKLGSCYKVSPRDRTLHGYDYVIILSWDMWMMFAPLEREALLLHEILHIFKDEKKGDALWKIEPHNVEEFGKVIEVYGLWKPDLQAFAKAIYECREPTGLKQVGFNAPMRGQPEEAQVTH